MRKPRHPLAVLRRIANLAQKELAHIAGVETVTIQKIESCRRRLTPELGLRISNQTGVSCEWLLKGDPRVPPVTDGGPDPYTASHYSYRQKLMKENFPGFLLPTMAAVALADMLKALAAAHEKRRSNECALHLVNLLAQLTEKFGEAAAVDRAAEQVITSCPRKTRDIFEPIIRAFVTEIRRLTPREPKRTRPRLWDQAHGPLDRKRPRPVQARRNRQPSH
jgi:transcriptional regulator with XRE-family HTH domain